MMEEADIVLERETANDEFATVVRIHVPSGSGVSQGQLLFEVENSKAVQEIESPIDGVVVHALQLNDEVDLGRAIARVVPPGQAAQTSPPDARRAHSSAAPSSAGATVVTPVQQPPKAHSPDVVTARPADRPPIFSRAAAALVKELNVDPGIFSTELVTAADVLAQARTADRPESAETPTAPSTIVEGKLVTASKRAEIQSLRSGAGGTLLSVLGTTLGPIAVARSGTAIVDDGITDLVLYEASRLMRQFANLNAAYADGAILHHPRVNGGLAIDTGGRLVVYGIEDSDRLDLADLRAAMDNGVARYLDGSLTGAEMSRATFSVTDLSGEELDYILPLLPAGQSCIIGVTRDSGGSYRLFAGFDHRVTEGREVGRFLGELASRVRSFAGRDGAIRNRCFYCERTALEEVQGFNARGLLRMVNAEGADILCCRACFDGW